ncbi:MAG: hypothetical protein GYA36_03765 [Veillonellaceae bacterium]|nr:hypothetical protein [Veillonellaceae bacterium]
MDKVGEKSILDFVADRRFQVIPLHFAMPDGRCTCGNPDCKHPGKHPREADWPNKGLPVADAVEVFRDRYGSRNNVGVLTGPVSGILVIDVDPRSGGLETLASWEAEHGPLPKTLTVHTGRFGDVRGQHLYFRYPDFEIGNKVGSIGQGIDVRGKGGVVVAPGSCHASGVRYSCDDPSAPVAELPAWLAEKLKAPAKKSTPNQNGGVSQQSRAYAVPEGGRNDYLFRRACLFLKAGVQQENLLERLAEENEDACAPPLDDDEVARIAESAIKYAEAFGDGDLGNARRFTMEHGRDVRFVEKLGGFLVWDGARWGIDEDGEIDRLAKQTITQLKIDAMDEPDPIKRKAMLRHAGASSKLPRIRAMVELAKSERPIAAKQGDFDREPWLLCVKNGTLDLKTGTLRPHRREDMLTKMAPVMFDPDAKCPNFERFMLSITGGDADLVLYLQKYIGYSLSGSTEDQSWLLLYGTGSNGKSTLLDVLRLLLGEYACNVPTSTLLAKKNDAASNDIAMMKGSRVVTAAESEAGRHLAEGLIKQVTGGDQVSARFMFREFFSYVPECKIFFATNHRPNIKGTDDGTWRRMRSIPFTQQFRDVREYPNTPAHLQKDLKLRDKLIAELPGILAWAVRGCLLWQMGGLTPPAAVSAATADYRAEMDVLAAFLDDACIVGKSERSDATALYQAFHDWCEENGEQLRTQRDFSRDLIDRGFEKRRSGLSGSYQYHGLRLRKTGLEGFEDAQNSDPMMILGVNKGEGVGVTEPTEGKKQSLPELKRDK